MQCKFCRGDISHQIIEETFKIFVNVSCFQLTSVGENPTYFRTFATDRKQVDFGREKGVFPLVLIQVKSAAKRTVFGPEKQARKDFSTV